MILLTPIVLAAADFALYVFGGNDATYSRTLLDWMVSRWYRLLGAFAMVFTAGLFFGHLFLAQNMTAAKYPTIARMVGR